MGSAELAKALPDPHDRPTFGRVGSDLKPIGVAGELDHVLLIAAALA